ncbi:hypothetical protein [Motilimonas pumila]|uniref:Uncharacterized protein n=1 Tax=Motilimonas pumila TaxID=2303987 RepID=A0A418YE12_9GAMM|nr:hypothetical protein [Motilimonas pumila]RJG42787.1 hypothetical protein D1Z90_11905 [Motilimonas pumila]
MQDPVTDALLQQGLQPQPETLGQSDIVLGMVVDWYGSRITYKVEQSTLMIICYERLNQKNKGLTNGFRDLMGLFLFVKSDVPAISHLTGKVDALPASDKAAGLTNQQLHRFYRDILQAPLAPDLGPDWYRWPIASLMTFRQHYRAMKAKA